MNGLRRPLILLSNDDGIRAEGLSALVRAMKKLGDVVVVAPDTGRSAVGHAITLSTPLRVRELVINGRFFGWSVNGMPADCIKIAVSSMLRRKPDLVVSGINAGANMGMDILYSGTVSAATEAAILGIPACAVSVASHEGMDFDAAAAIASVIARALLKNPLPFDTVLNVNIPGCAPADIRGIRVTSQSRSRFRETYEKRSDPRNEVYYWLTGEFQDVPDERGTDVNAVREGFVSVTPLSLSLTNAPCVAMMNGWKLSLRGVAAVRGKRSV